MPEINPSMNKTSKQMPPNPSPLHLQTQPLTRTSFLWPPFLSPNILHLHACWSVYRSPPLSSMTKCPMPRFPIGYPCLQPSTLCAMPLLLTMSSWWPLLPDLRHDGSPMVGASLPSPLPLLSLTKGNLVPPRGCRGAKLKQCIY